MHFIKKSTLVAAATLFTIALFWFVALLGFQRVISSTSNIKDALKQSGVYETVIQDALAQSQKEQAAAGSDIPVHDARVRAVIAQAFPPTYLQQQTEGVLDNTFAWLEGNSPKLTFTIDVADAKVRLADGLAAYTRERAATLPACSAATPPSNGDVFSATCLPPGVNPDIAAAEARNQILQGEFLKDNQLSAETLKGKDGKPLDEQLKQLPVAYQRMQDAVFGLAVLIVLLGTAVVLLSVTWQAGVRKVAIIAIVVGVLGVLLNVLTGKLVSTAHSNADLSQPLQQSMFAVVEQLIGDARTWWLIAGLGLIVLGVAALIALRFTKAKLSDDPAEKIELPVTDDTIGAHTAKPNSSSHSRHNTKL